MDLSQLLLNRLPSHRKLNASLGHICVRHWTTEIKWLWCFIKQWKPLGRIHKPWNARLGKVHSWTTVCYRIGRKRQCLRFCKCIERIQASHRRDYSAFASVAWQLRLGSSPNHAQLWQQPRPVHKKQCSCDHVCHRLTMTGIGSNKPMFYFGL